MFSWRWGNKILFLTILIFCLIPGHGVIAQTLRGTFVDWSVFTIKQADKTICYIAALPLKRDGTYNKRGDPYFLVTDVGNDIEEISVSGGYYFKKNSEVELSFGLKKFGIFTYDNLAWANNKSDDIDIVKEMRNSEDVIVTGIARDNSYSVDTYSLVGFVEAYNKMKELCNN